MWVLLSLSPKRVLPIGRHKNSGSMLLGRLLNLPLGCILRLQARRVVSVSCAAKLNEIIWDDARAFVLPFQMPIDTTFFRSTPPHSIAPLRAAWFQCDEQASCSPSWPLVFWGVMVYLRNLSAVLRGPAPVPRIAKRPLPIPYTPMAYFKRETPLLAMDMRLSA